MKERPILFQGEMVRAILAGTKTQTRRLVKPRPEWENLGIPGVTDAIIKWMLPPLDRCPYGKPGDRLWVRETWAYHLHAQAGLRDEDGPFVYAADGDPALRMRLCERWRPSIHMPRAASRLTLEITDVRVERLQDISEADALAEGIALLNGRYTFNGGLHESRTAVDSYRALWESINGAGSWNADTWVWAVSFKRTIEAQPSNEHSASGSPARQESRPDATQPAGSLPALQSKEKQ